MKASRACLLHGMMKYLNIPIVKYNLFEEACLLQYVRTVNGNSRDEDGTLDYFGSSTALRFD